MLFQDRSGGVSITRFEHIKLLFQQMLFRGVDVSLCQSGCLATISADVDAIRRVVQGIKMVLSELKTVLPSANFFVGASVWFVAKDRASAQLVQNPPSRLFLQSTNINSEVLKMSRPTLAMPFFFANGTSFFISAVVGRRLSESRYTSSI